MDLLSAIATRASHGVLAEPAPNAGELEQMIAAAMSAPDHGRLKPWRFIVFEGAARETIGTLMAASLKRRVPDAAEAMLAHERKKAFRAPMIIAVVSVVVPDLPKVPPIEQILSAGAAAENLLLAAHALDYGGMWRSGDFIFDPETKAALHLAPKDQIVGMLYIGTIVGPARERSVTIGDALVRWPA